MADRYDVIIVGGGAAGLTAALFASRRALKTLVLSQDIGGQASTTASIENYPGIDFTDGLELMNKFRSQAEKHGATVILSEVQLIENTPDGRFTVGTSGQTYESDAVILAYGLTHRHLGVPGEEALIGKGVTYCATCDAPLYKSKKVVVVGGGNSAMDAALLLSKLASEVSIIATKEEFRGEHVLIERLLATPNIKPYMNGVVTEIRGQDKVTGVSFTSNEQPFSVDVDGVFVEIGFTVNPALVRGIVELDQKNQVIVNPTDNSTSVPGVFAAGDVTSVNQKQIIISAGEGAKAALGVYQYLQSLGKAKRAGLVDWGVKTPMHHDDPK